jgi:hypothetical protein
LSDEQKPSVSNLGDLKARLGKLKQGNSIPTSTQPSASEHSFDPTQQMPVSGISSLNSPNHTHESGADPFAAAQLVGKPVPAQNISTIQRANPFVAAPAASANPFASAPAASVNPLASVNPFASASTANANPFASAPVNPSVNVAPAPSASMNLFANASANGVPAPAPSTPAVAPTGSINPFAASQASTASNANPFAVANTADSVEHSAFKPNVTNESSSNNSSTANQNQAFQELAPLRFGAQVQTEHEFADAINSGYNPNLIKKKLAITMTIAAGIVALLIGILMGGAVSQRRAHNLRVGAWQNINNTLKTPFDNYDKMNDLFTKMLAKKAIQWNLLESLPKKLSPISATLLATPAPLEQKALASLSTLIQELNQFFAQVQEHRSLSLGLRSELKAFEEGKGFEQYVQYAIHAKDFFDSCIKRGRMSCKAPNPAQPPKGRVVAIAGRKLKSVGKQKQIDVVNRQKLDPKPVNAAHLIQIPKIDVTGFGDSVFSTYQMRLVKIYARLKNLRKLKVSFDKILSTKLTKEKIITL